MKTKFKKGQLVVLNQAITICCLFFPEGTIMKIADPVEVNKSVKVFKKPSSEQYGEYSWVKTELFRPLSPPERLYAKAKWGAVRFGSSVSVNKE